MATPADWIDGLAEGVVLFEGDRVVRINSAAGTMLDADPAWAAGKRLITVLRDHRLERVCLHGDRVEVRLAGRVVEAVPIPGGMALRDLSEARRAREEAEALLATLSHELRTPMTTVRSTLEALEIDDLDPGEKARLLERAVHEADRVVRLLGDLTTEVSPPRERRLPLAEVLARAQQILAPMLEERGVRLEDATGRQIVWADPDKVLQVILNLIENASIHGPEGGGVVVQAEPDNGWVKLMVRDQGEPLPLDSTALTALQQPVRGPRSRENGVGLYVVRSIAEGWGGHAWWRDADGHGNEFGVLLPGSREAARQPPRESPERPG
ncbi:MAG TPA: ATP-binding protein [Trueperaceae bacterium]